MQRYVGAARRYRWLLAGILALVWGAGLVAAYVEYNSTFESVATVWVLRASPELALSTADDPTFPVIGTAATQQSDLFNQLLKTKSFLRDVVERTSLRPALERARDPDAYLKQIGTRIRVQALGTNLLSVSFSGRDPQAGPEMVRAALAARGERVAQARIKATAALTTLYEREYELAQAQVIDAQRKLDAFNESHTGALSGADQEQQTHLRLTVNLAQVRINDLKARMDRSVLAPQLLEISGMEFQVVDDPTEPTAPSGGMRAAGSLAGVAMVSGIALAALLILVGGLLPDHLAGPADVNRIESARLFATVPRVARPRGPAPTDFRTALAAIAFGDGRAAEEGTDDRRR